MADQVTECYSCGNEASPDSPRQFCTNCDAEFEVGLENQKRVYARAYLLEEAKFNEDVPRVKELMGEIFQESFVAPQPVSQPVSSATVKKGDK